MQPRRTARPARPGFTLIELLVVIAVIALLLAIALPSFNRVRENARATATQARVVELNSACELFYQDKQFYPGQNALWRLEATGDQRLTGTQLLAAALYDYDYANIHPQGGDWRPDLPERRENPKTYADMGDHVRLVEGMDPDGVQNMVPHDSWPQGPLPILYFPSRRGASQELVYRFADNVIQGTGSPANGFIYGAALPQNRFGTSAENYQTFFANHLLNPRSAGNPDKLESTRLVGANAVDRYYRHDSFLLIAAGIDRMYFTEDDNTNFQWADHADRSE